MKVSVKLIDDKYLAARKIIETRGKIFILCVIHAANISGIWLKCDHFDSVPFIFNVFYTFNSLIKAGGNQA